MSRLPSPACGSAGDTGMERKKLEEAMLPSERELGALLRFLRHHSTPYSIDINEYG